MKFSFLGVFVLIILLISCEQEVVTYKEYDEYVSQYQDLPDNQVNQLLKKVIDYSGGWDAYCNIKSVDYKKTVQKIDSSGGMESSVVQHHQYNVFPEFGVSMKWKEGEDEYLILNNAEQSWKVKNGELLTDIKNKNSGYNSSFGSQYVLFMPWKLADPGVILEYIPLTKLPNDKEAVGIKINYTKDNSTTTEHTWWYYFEEETGKPVATFLKSPQNYSYTEFNEFTKVGDILFHSKRQAYNSDSTMNNLILKTVYINEDIKIGSGFSSKKFNYNG